MNAKHTPEPWIAIDDQPMPIRKRIEALHNDGKTIIVGQCLRPSNAITGPGGMRWVVTHWRRRAEMRDERSPK